MTAGAAPTVRLDTHVVVWLYSGEVDKLSRRAAELIETSDLVVSAMVQLELSFLHEIGRLGIGGADIVADLATRIRLRVSPVPLMDAVSAATALTFTRDPFDRLIAGDALAAATHLLTRDDDLLDHLEMAVW